MSLAWEKPCRIFSFEAIRKATNNFSKLIGEGGFGKVYKGLIDDGSTTTVVAVKRLNPGSKSNQGAREFETEIKMLSKFRHCHLVCLVGYCNEQSEMILVYEYLSNGTLADHLYKNQNSSLTWERRIKICIGAARGLDYLHTGTGLEDRVIHLDVKCANILLDENFAAKIADLGLSKTGPANQPYSEVITNHIRGTRGYIDPQYRMSSKFSRKADVYAFGVVLLEVLSGTRAIGGGIIPDSDLADLADWIKEHIRNGTLYQIVDRRVASQVEKNCLQIFANTACKSLHKDPKKRPTMTEVVAQLESALASQKNTNPSTSMTDNHLLQHFNRVNRESSSKATSERVSEDSEIWSSMGVSMEEYLGTERNIFGEPIRNEKMVRMGLDPTRENKAQIAYKMMYHGNKYDNALRFVNEFKLQWGKVLHSTRCLLYNATGETLTQVASRTWGIGKPSSFPRVILNGQWGAYRHTKSWLDTFTTATVVVYRCKYSENDFCNYIIAWSDPWQRVTQDLTAYCEINEVEHFDDAVWEEIYRKTRLASRENSVLWRDFYTKVSIENLAFTMVKATLTRVDVITTSRPRVTG